MAEPRARATEIEHLFPWLMHWSIADERIGGFRSDAYALQTPAGVVVVDPVPLRPDLQARLENVSGIFLTHAHIGHYTGLMHLGREVMGSRGMPVYAMPRMRSFLSGNGPWSQLVDLGNIELRALEGEDPTSLGEGVTVRAMPVPHREEFSETVAFRIDRGERSVLFLPDIDKWERWDTDINQLLLEVDVAFVDGTDQEDDLTAVIVKKR